MEGYKDSKLERIRKETDALSLFFGDTDVHHGKSGPRESVFHPRL